MPILRDAEILAPYLVYEAPVNEKTTELRKKFDIDEKTGYPKHYEWRSMAKLGPDHKPEDALIKLGKYDPQQFYTTTATISVLITATTVGIHCFINKYRAQPLWANSWKVVGIVGLALAAYKGIENFTHTRAGIKNQIYIDYMRKHPERFGTIHRPKLREVLLPYYAPRC